MLISKAETSLSCGERIDRGDRRGEERRTDRVDVELCFDPLPRFFIKILQIGQIDGVETVDDGDAQGVRAEDIGPVTCLRDWTMFVRSPPVLRVIGVGVENHLSGEREERAR